MPLKELMEVTEKMGKRTRRTPEQRKADAEALQVRLVEQVDELRKSDTWARYLRFAAAFHAYSVNNVLLIMAQCPQAARVAGFRKWQELGRQVRKGEKSIKIFGYSTKKVTEENENGDEVEKTITRFPILSVFDISQTDPIEGADQPEEIARRLEGTDEYQLYERTAAHLAANGWTIDRDDLGSHVNGYTTADGTHRVVVDENLSDAQAAKTMLHEAAHVTLNHHTLPDSAYVTHRGACEVEAESVAHVVAGLAGLDTSAYSVGYVTGWADGDADAIRDAATNVLRATHELADALKIT